jgi:hypothetical protein
MNPIISVVAPAIRENYYARFCESLQQTAPKVTCDGDTDPIPFEIVFVGSKPPTGNMPDNFRYIETNVKPAQCAEIAARYAVGEYLLTAADDYLYSENYLRKMYWFSRKINMDKAIFLNVFRGTPRKTKRGQKIRVIEWCSFWPYPETPLTHPNLMVKKKIWHELGGLDKRYQTIFYDVDFQLRCYESGMVPFIVPECLVSEHDLVHSDGQPRLTLRDSSQSQHDLTTSLWCENESFSPHRLSDLQPFVDENILVKDQT